MNKLLEIGDVVAINVFAKIIDRDLRHGACYQVLLPNADFTAPRTVWLNADEIRLHPSSRRREITLAGKAIHHIDGNPRNNDISNLGIVDVKENTKENTQ